MIFAGLFMLWYDINEDYKMVLASFFAMLFFGICAINVTSHDSSKTKSNQSSSEDWTDIDVELFAKFIDSQDWTTDSKGWYRMTHATKDYHSITFYKLKQQFYEYKKTRR